MIESDDDAAHTDRYSLSPLLTTTSITVAHGGAGSGKLCDFGLAKRRQQDATNMTITTGVGTPVYMAPETIVGDSVGDGTPIDVRLGSRVTRRCCSSP